MVGDQRAGPSVQWFNPSLQAFGQDFKSRSCLPDLAVHVKPKQSLKMAEKVSV